MPKEEPCHVWPKEEPVDVEMQPIPLLELTPAPPQNPIMLPHSMPDAPEMWISSLPSECLDLFSALALMKWNSG